MQLIDVIWREGSKVCVVTVLGKEYNLYHNRVNRVFAPIMLQTRSFRLGVRHRYFSENKELRSSYAVDVLRVSYLVATHASCDFQYVLCYCVEIVHRDWSTGSIYKNR